MAVCLSVNHCSLEQKANKDSQASLGMVAHTCNPNTYKAEERNLQVQGQPGLHSDFNLAGATVLVTCLLAMIKYHEQDYSGSYGSREIKAPPSGKHAASMTLGAKRYEPRAHILNHKHQTERAN